MKRVFALVVCLCMVFAMVPAVSAATGNVSLNGNAIYNTVEEALAAAVAGDTVTLNADVTAGQVIVPKGVTLDLGGYNLEAAVVIAMNGEISGGNVVVAEDMLKVIGNNGGKLAVWNSENGAYSFAEPSYQQLMNVAEDLSYAHYIFVPYMDAATTALLADGGADNGISVKVLLTWNEGASQQIYTFSDELVAQVYGGNYALVFQLTITGFAGIEDMTACAVVESAAGGKATNVESAVALPVEPEETQPAETEPSVPATEPVETEPAGPSGEIAIESYGNAEWIAPQDGYVKFTINISGATFAVLDGWTLVAEGVDSITAQVVAGTTYGIYPNYDVTEASVVTWEYVAAPEGGDEGGSGGDVEVVPSGEALALGSNNVTLTYATMPMMAPYWTYTANENGYLSVTVASINGETNLGMAFGRGMYTLLVGETDGMYTNTATVYMNAGESIEIRVLDSMDMTEVPAVLDLSFEAGSSEPVVEKNPADYFETNENGNYIIGSLESPVDIFVGNDDIYYYYVAEGDGNVIVTPAIETMGGNQWLFVNGVCYYGAGSVNVTTGDVVLVNVWSGFEGTVSFEAGEYIPTEPAEPEETEPALPGTMDNPYVIDELPYNVYFYGYMDEYYSYTATEEGNIIVSGLEGALLSLPWGDSWEEDENGNYIIPVIADYELMMNFWTFAEEIDGFMTITFQPAASEPEETEPVIVEKELVLTVDALGLPSSSYTSSTATVDGVGFEWFELGNYGNGIQVRSKNGNSYMFNTSAFGVGIKEIRMVYNAAKNTYTNADAEIISFGNEAGNYSYETSVSVTAGTTEYVVTPDADTYTFVKFYHNLSYAGYWDSVTIVYYDVSDGTEPEEPPVETEPVETEPVETEPVETDPAADSVLTIAEAIALGASKEHNAYTEGKYYVTGVITEVYNTTYGNMRIKDAEGNILTVYGTYSADGSVRYDAMDVKPVAGDTVTVYGIIGQYNGSAQVKNGWIVTHTAVEPEETQPVETEPVETEPVETEPAGSQVVDAPVAGIAYKFGMIQKNVSETDVYYLNGNMSGYYMGTTTDAGAAVDVYLEETEGGYYLYAMVNGAKQYINMVVSGTYVNGKYEDAAATVYTYNEDSKTVIAVVNDTDYWMGTRNDMTYTTVGPVKTSYNGFYMQFYAEAATEPEEPPVETEPVETEPVETEPVETEPVEGAETTVSKTVAELITEYGWTSTTTKQSFVLDDVVSVKINGGNNTGKAYNGDHIRIYATDTPAGTITISVAEGHELVSVKISTVTGTYASLCVDGTTEDICNTTATVSGTSVVLNSVKVGTDGKQVRVTAIEVTYK